MTPDSQALYLHAVPLLVLAAVYLAVAAALAPALWRDRGRVRDAALPLALIFPGLGTAALLAGIGVLSEGEPLFDSTWLGLGAIAAALVPGLAFLLRRQDRAALFASSRAREAEARTSADEERRATLAAFTRGLADATDATAVGRLLAEAAAPLLRVELVGLLEVRGDAAHGIGAWRGGKEVPWWREVAFDLEEPSLVASVVYEAAPATVYDLVAATPPPIQLTQRLPSGSAAFVPLVLGDEVIAVVVAITEIRRAFSTEDLALLQELAAEAALALERGRSGSALQQALERERLVSRIAFRVRSELDLAAVLRTAVDESAAALDVSRCFIRLEAGTGPAELRAEWCGEGVRPLSDVSESLPVANLAVRERRTIAVADVLDAPELEDPALGSREALAALGTRAALATPIMIFGEVSGVFAAHRSQPGEWSPGELALAEAVARELGLAIHTARLLGENQRRLQQQQALLQAAHAVTGELQLEAVLQRLVDEVAALLGGDAADCYLLDERGAVLTCAAVHGLPPTVVGSEFPATSGLSGRALQQRRAVIEPDYGAAGTSLPSAAYEGYAAAIVAPVLSGERVRGVLGVATRGHERSFDERDAEALEGFAALAALALRNAEAYEERARQAQVQRGFYRIASALAQPLSLEGTFEALAVAAAESLGGEFAAVLTPQGGRLVLAGDHAVPPELSAPLAEGLPAGRSVLGTAAAESRIVAAPRLPEDDRFDGPWRELVARAGARSLLAVPIRADREEAGSALVLVFFTAPRTFTDDDLELAGHLAGAARAALERSGRYEEERVARSLAQQLARVGTLLTAELETAALLTEVVQQAPRLLGADACAIRVLEGDDLVVSAAEGEGTTELVGTRGPASVWLSGDVLQSGAPVAVADAAGDDRLLAADPLLAAGYRAYLGVPLGAAEGAIHGVLALYSRRPRAWRPDAIEALRALAGNASAALSNAELYQRVALEKERSFAILANIADGIVAVNREGEVVLWNRAAEHITGVPAEEAVGRTPLQVLGRNLELDGGVGPGDRLVPILRGGEEAWLSVTEAVMRDPAGAVAGRIYAFRDISADRLVEQMKSDFVSTVSQELRRPLTSIYGFAETLLRRDVLFGEEEQRVFLGYIASESERLASIVDALLNVARLDAGDLQMNLATVDVRGVVEDVVAARRDGDGVDAHSFVVDVPDEPVPAVADGDKLRQVLSHLLDNAIKYSPEGGTVTVAARRRGETVELSVDDEGVGIPQAEQERIFRKFYRADPRTAGASGPGLGLFIAQRLVGAMGGRIRVVSREGEGSSFSFDLPAVVAQMRESEETRV